MAHEHYFEEEKSDGNDHVRNGEDKDDECGEEAAQPDGTGLFVEDAAHHGGDRQNEEQAEQHDTGQRGGEGHAHGREPFGGGGAGNVLDAADTGAIHAISEHESVAVFCPEILKVKTILRPFSPSS